MLRWRARNICVCCVRCNAGGETSAHSAILFHAHGSLARSLYLSSSSQRNFRYLPSYPVAKRDVIRAILSCCFALREKWWPGYEDPAFLPGPVFIRVFDHAL